MKIGDRLLLNDGGIDTFDFSQQLQVVRTSLIAGETTVAINEEEGSLATALVIIADDVVIENLIGTSFNDELVGMVLLMFLRLALVLI